MKQIGAEIGVNESRVSQLHARAVQRLRQSLGSDVAPAQAAAMMRPVLLAFRQKEERLRMAKMKMAVGSASQPAPEPETDPQLPIAVGAGAAAKAVVLPYDRTSRTTRSKSASLNGLASQRQPLSSRNRSASVATTSPVTNTTRRASDGAVAAMAR
jgi:hypothetical protein